MIQIKKFNSFQNIGELSLMPIMPFQSLWYQKIFIKHFCQEKDLILLGIYQDNNYIGYANFEKTADSVVFLGMKPVLNNQEVTDYGDILINSNESIDWSEIWKSILQWFSENNFKKIQLDYVREDSKTYQLFKDKAIKQVVAPYIDLPASWEEYLLSLDRVDRKELKRKLRRLEMIKNIYYCRQEVIQEDFKEFIRLHKLSSQAKNEFMSGEMKRFFWDLIIEKKPIWQTSLCFLKIEEKNTAALFFFENESQILGYNSGYDPNFNYYSVGLLLHAYKIKQAIESGRKRYDFMRGNERYKFDLGGKAMPLYQIKISL